MSSSSSAKLVPRISGIEGSIQIDNVTEVPLVDASRQILNALDRFRYYIVLRNWLRQVKNYAAVQDVAVYMPVSRATHFNVMVDDLNEETVTHRYLCFANADGSIGSKISIYGEDLAQAVDICANSFIPMIKMIRKAGGTDVSNANVINSSVLFKGTIARASVDIPLSVRTPDVFVEVIAAIFGFDKDAIYLRRGYWTYDHDLPFMK